jgi:hypothetical protein
MPPPSPVKVAPPAPPPAPRQPSSQVPPLVTTESPPPRKKQRPNIAHLRDCSLPCALCGYVAPNENAFIKHSEDHARGKNFRCDICDAMLGKDFNLKSHKLIHDEDSPTYPCTKCKRSFGTRGNLQHHINGVHLMKKVRCPICGEPRSGDMNRHKRSRKCREAAANKA